MEYSSSPHCVNRSFHRISLNWSQHHLLRAYRSRDGVLCALIDDVSASDKLCFKKLPSHDVNQRYYLPQSPVIQTNDLFPFLHFYLSLT